MVGGVSAEILREAADLMRERAAAAPEQAPVRAQVSGVWLGSRHYLTVTPEFLLAVAYGLDADAGVLERHDLDVTISHAYSTARAYLGGDA